LKDYGAATYGEYWADIYDEWAAERFPEEVTEAAVAALAALDTSGRALELGVGTGRIALPLRQRGLDVHGIDASEAMLTRLREKAGSDITLTLADFANFDVDGRYGLVFVVFNTFYVLPTQQQQASCFACVARHLDDGGVFVIEAFVPDPTRFDGGQTLRTLRVDTEQVHLEASLHDPVAQTIRSQHVTVGPAGIELRPVHIRYVWPSEMDLMARLAGLQLRERWGGWDRSQFGESSRTHISIYEHAD
jgi:SAM-dependent methyltransferase